MRIYYFGELVADTKKQKEIPPKRRKIKVTINDVFVEKADTHKPPFTVRNWANA